ncbi:MAG: tetratricopeptide repeat protein [Planctomycetota bacterium]|jgi:tetratricopeptide (TPR) repeat protein
MMDFACPNCGHRVYSNDAAAGTKKPCVYCGTMLEIPAAQETSMPATPVHRSRYAREKLTLLGGLIEAPWFRPALCIVLGLLAGGVVCYFVVSMLLAVKPAHHMTQPEFIQGLHELTEKSPYGELSLVRKKDFIRTFGKPDSEIMHNLDTYDGWHQLNYRTKNASVVVNYVDEVTLPDGKPSEGWVKVWIANEEADRRAERELNDPKIYQKGREANEYYEKNKETISSTISRADALVTSGQYKQAIGVYEDAKTIIQEAPQVQEQLSGVLREVEGKVKTARSKWEQTVDREASRMLQVAKESLETNELDNAETQYQELLRYVADNGIRTDSLDSIVQSAEKSLEQIAELKREAELERQVEERHREELAQLHLWDEAYDLSLKIYTELSAAPGTDHLARTNELMGKLSLERTELQQVFPSDKCSEMHNSIDQAHSSVEKYCEKLRELNDGLHADDPLSAKKLAAGRKLYQSATQNDLVVFVYEYVTARQAAGESPVIESVSLRKAVETEGIRRRQCTACLGKGFEFCLDCVDRGRPTGKMICTECLGVRFLTCPNCDGDFGSKCSKCGGKGKVYTRINRNPPKGAFYVKKKTSEKCWICRGNRTTWSKKGSSHREPGTCPMCSRNRGKVFCNVCKGTGRAGSCLTCDGEKKFTCRQCKGTGKRQMDESILHAKPGENRDQRTEVGKTVTGNKIQEAF